MARSERCPKSLFSTGKVSLVLEIFKNLDRACSRPRPERWVILHMTIRDRRHSDGLPYDANSRVFLSKWLGSQSGLHVANADFLKISRNPDQASSAAAIFCVLEVP